MAQSQHGGQAKATVERDIHRRLRSHRLSFLLRAVQAAGRLPQRQGSGKAAPSIQPMVVPRPRPVRKIKATNLPSMAQKAWTKLLISDP